jgi:hypothetical protein
VGNRTHALPTANPRSSNSRREDGDGDCNPLQKVNKSTATAVDNLMVLKIGIDTEGIDTDFVTMKDHRHRLNERPLNISAFVSQTEQERKNSKNEHSPASSLLLHL